MREFTLILDDVSPPFRCDLSADTMRELIRGLPECTAFAEVKGVPVKISFDIGNVCYRGEWTVERAREFGYAAQAALDQMLRYQARGKPIGETVTVKRRDALGLIAETEKRYVF